MRPLLCGLSAKRMADRISFPLPLRLFLAVRIAASVIHCGVCSFALRDESICNAMRRAA